MDKVTKNYSESEEFYIPHCGLDLDYYLNFSIPENATAMQIRLQKQAIHHLGRYYWAIEVLSGRQGVCLLDIACGAGYGSYLLAKALPGIKVIGGDYDPRSAEYANNAFGGLPNLSFETMDLVSWERANGSSIGEQDVIVCFDTIEHLNFREIALINIAENLSEDGIFLFSTPSGSKKNKLYPGWEHHKIEYSYNYIINLMKRFFLDVRIPDDETLPENIFWKDKINKDVVKYYNKANPMFCAKPIKFNYWDLKL